MSCFDLAYARLPSVFTIPLSRSGVLVILDSLIQTQRVDGSFAEHL